jgi:pyruvate/2-oxoglutarate dehydrogenase complex dihydrolipoamide dehydrogenase (E3) component
VTTVGDVPDFHLIVIGGGTAGMTVAKQVARAGKRVALVEAARTGGDCLYTGCVPSKSLIATARVLHEIRRASAFGVDVDRPALDLPRAVVRKDRIIARIAVVDAPDALERAGVTVIHGTARLLGPHVVVVDDRPLRAERLVIATGSRPAIPPIPGLAEAGFVTNEDLMARTTAPARLAVIGAGPVGLELGQASRRFGSAVTVVGRTPNVEGLNLPAAGVAIGERGIRVDQAAFDAGLARNGPKAVAEFRAAQERWARGEDLGGIGRWSASE